MNGAQELRCYELAEASFDRIWNNLERDAAGILRRATRVSAARVRPILADLRADAAWIERLPGIEVEVRALRETLSALDERTTELDLEWRIGEGLPTLAGALRIYPVAAHETRLDFNGRSFAPAGRFGETRAELGVHRVAELFVLALLRDVAAQLEAASRQPVLAPGAAAAGERSRE